MVFFDLEGEKNRILPWGNGIGGAGERENLYCLRKRSEFRGFSMKGPLRRRNCSPATGKGGGGGERFSSGEGKKQVALFFFPTSGKKKRGEHLAA